MTDICQSSIGIVKRAQTPNTQGNTSRVSVKANQVANSFAKKHCEISQSTFHKMVIKPNKLRNKRKQLPHSLMLTPFFGCGSSLKRMVIESQNDSQIEVERVSRFPFSHFKIHSNSEKATVIDLSSNFTGSKYNLKQNNQIVMTISFQAGLCGKHPIRRFSIFYLAKGIGYSNLFKSNTGADLEVLFEVVENQTQILKISNEEPSINPEGNYSMNFGRKNVLPAVQNSVMVDDSGKELMELVKVDRDVFEVSMSQQMQPEMGVAVALASLDFKWALE